jgi:hypothetical protein
MQNAAQLDSNRSEAVAIVTRIAEQKIPEEVS